MAESTDKTEQSAEKAYAAAAAAAEAKLIVPAAVAPPAVNAKTPKPLAKKPVPAAKPVKGVASPSRKAAARPALKSVAQVPAPVAMAPVVLAAPAITPPKPSITELKEKIMATAKTPDFTKPIADAFGEIQIKAKAAYEKGTEAMTEATEFAKGNVEALVESGKIFAGGAQDLGKTYVDEAKGAYETFSADLKEFAAVKSPTELFQLQGKIMRRNFDSFVAASSKNSEAAMKLANDAFAPISGRMTVAAEKLSKVA
jgi:hypothetical protein